MKAWQRIADEARGGFGAFPLRAYSEFMPPPYVGLKPYGTFTPPDEDVLEIDEYEQAHDLAPGLDWIAQHLLHELGKLVRGEPHALSHSLLDGNPAWPAGTKAPHDPLLLIQPLALSRTQDDKGNFRWTLFGGSDAPKLAEAEISAIVAWAGLGEWRSIGGGLPRPYRGEKVATIVTFEPLAQLPREIRDGYLAGTITLVPSPASLVFAHHPRYAQLELRHATQIPLLHLFPRVESACAIRIPQSGWLDEKDPGIVRTHRWQRRARDEDIHGDGAYTDKVSVALFSTDPVAVDLYDKPLARNAQIWTSEYEPLLDGPRADRAAIEHAARVVDAGGRFGYRMYYPPMRAGHRELFWHLPLVACEKRGRFVDGPHGHITAEGEGAPIASPGSARARSTPAGSAESIVLEPRLLARPQHVAAAKLFPRDPGLPRHTTTHNVRKLLDLHAQLGPLEASFARALLHTGKDRSLEDWLAELPRHATDHTAAGWLVSSVRAAIVPDRDPGAPHVLHRLGTRAFEEEIWTTISHLAHGEFRQKNDADGITVNRGKHGGPAAKAAHIVAHDRRDLEALGDHLHARYRALIAKHGLGEVLDHVFRWETDFAFPWMEGWAKNQEAPRERNIVFVIPGKRHDEAVIMGDHYDTAYMEDVFYPETGGDFLRAPARGADDNHSATTALLLAAEQLLPLAKAGVLERDVWLVHLTGEEFPGDCMGARALAQALVEKNLALTAEDGTRRDMSSVRVTGAFILDMIGHNTHRELDVFQIAPGEGAGASRLAQRAHRANVLWNRLCAEWNRERPGAGRAQRSQKAVPALFAHLPVRGEVRVEWEPRSALYNTDGQIFSDLGIPVVLFMENYDISRKGYHDTHDTMENIDLDYCAALTAIAIETVADTATAR